MAPTPENPSIAEAALAGIDPTQVQCLGELIKSTTASFRDLEATLQAAIKHLVLLSQTIDNALVIDEAELITSETPPYSSSTRITSLDGKVCGSCGGMMQRTGACYTCPSCGENDGCG